jgi:hypothetical protein
VVVFVISGDVMNFNVFADFHHEELYESLRILFEDRFKANLYRQIGQEWYTEGFWKVCQHINSVEQFLTPAKNEEFYPTIKGQRFVGDALTIADSKTLRYTSYSPVEISPGVLQVKNSVYPDKAYKAISLAAFKETRFDILLCSIPAHIPVFQKLKALYQPRAKIVFQLGNNWKIPNDVEHILCSTSVDNFTNTQNWVRYHQEFDTSLFKHSIPSNLKSIYSIMHYTQEPASFFALEKLLNGWDFKMYGGGNRDGILGPSISDIAETFKNKMAFLWHVKKEGDGFGYNMHRAVACGRPIIIRRSYIKGMTPEMLLREGTYIDLDHLSINDAVKKILNMYENYEQVSEDINNKFINTVNYDLEFEKISKFIEKVLL